MGEHDKTYGDLLIERDGKGFSEQKLIKVLREVLAELETLHASQQAHGHISPDALIQNSATKCTTIKPPPAPTLCNQASIGNDLYDLGTTIIILLTGKRLEALKGSDGLLRWQDDRLVSDIFSNVINKATERNPSLRYASAAAMLQDLEEQSRPCSFPSLQEAAPPEAQSQIDGWLASSQPAAPFLPRPTATFGIQDGKNEDSIRQKSLKSTRFSMLVGAALLGAVLTLFAGFLYQHFHPQAQTSSGDPGMNGNLNANPYTSPEQIPAGDTTADQATFTGISLPITNKLCTNSGNFCIYNLASLINRESGEATYSFSETHEGQLVNINGRISIENLQKESGRRIFTFAFRDDQTNTTPGWAAAGSFRLDQDNTKPGILTRFKTTESFGPKTPIGLENTAYVFPR